MSTVGLPRALPLLSLCADLAFECKGCSNHCEIVGIKVNDETVARWGSRCGKWDVV